MALHKLLEALKKSCYKTNLNLVWSHSYRVDFMRLVVQWNYD
jgi:hypothetical protein